MAENKKERKRHQEVIEKSVQKIYEREEARKKAGRDSFEAGWQAALETILLMMERHLLEYAGQLLPMQIIAQKEWEFYLDLQEKLDLPPDTCGVLITPSASKDMPFPESPEVNDMGTIPWQREGYSVIISRCQDHTVVLQASLPGVESVGIDVFEDGKHFADYTYYTIEECLDDLTKVTWIHFNPKGDWTEEQITRYTENWFAKTLDLFNLEDVPIHSEYSYVHHPELLGLNPLESAFKLITATIPKEYDSLEKAIETANEFNRDFELGDPLITKEGILQDNKGQCQALLGRIAVEMDQLLDILSDLEGTEFSRPSTEDFEHKRIFDETARQLYKEITGRPCPKSAQIW